VVKELPKDHPAVLASPPTTGATATLLPYQPIIHDKDGNVLVISPIVFGHLTKAEIEDIQNLGARKALNLLRERYTGFLKERLPGLSGSTKKKSKHKNKPSKAAESVDGSSAQHVKQGTFNVSGTPAPDGEGPALKKRRLETDVIS